MTPTNATSTSRSAAGPSADSKEGWKPIGKRRNGGPVGDVEWDRVHVGQVIEAIQGGIGARGGIDVPAPPPICSVIARPIPLPAPVTSTEGIVRPHS